MIYAHADKSLRSRCWLRREGVIVDRGLRTDVCITEDLMYVVIDPDLPDDLQTALLLVMLRGAVPPDEKEYPKVVKSIAEGLRDRAIWALYRDYREVVHYLLDRWSGARDYMGYGALEAMMKDPLLTEIVIPQATAPAAKYTYVPKNLREQLEYLRFQVVELGRYRRVVAVRNEIRLPTNITIPEPLMYVVVKQLLPSLTMDKPMLTREDPVHKARIAADLIEYNVNIRKTSAYPKPSKALLRPYLSRPRLETERVSSAYSPEGLELLALASLVLETKGGVVFSGGMGSGKTTQLNQLLYLTPPWFQVVVVERGAREIWAPLDGQLLHISVPGEEKLWAALDQALRYGTMHTVVALAEARTPAELRTLVNYKLTGHGALTTMHADTVKDAVLRIVEAEAPPEGLHGMLIIQLSAIGGTRFVKEAKAVVVEGGRAQVAEVSALTPAVSSYVEEMYGVDLKKELALRMEALVKAAEMEDPISARKTIEELLWLKRLDLKTAVKEEASRFGYV
ncbi:type II/IV secretion system ATPase subunit [Pyrobaculum neutrophilum]|uniref:Type II secretion system protein, conjectural n=1 Tax=Pyrobaculum neutrophilum (strain DSM 2338 / JCM 9278 / NBRC 100436 / V24Sta) TaxID=444157 RepID=B1Y8S0_PYRNV|nr:type II/IV secretion system ATPase subunit [Pyrobaculum neutrophilum]ACB40149.1 type II secretion system protein, conjectural [Pyrobaculum neutrophilum V24Sta]